MNLEGYGFRSRRWNAALAARARSRRDDRAGVSHERLAPTGDEEKKEKKGTAGVGQCYSGKFPQREGKRSAGKCCRLCFPQLTLKFW